MQVPFYVTVRVGYSLYQWPKRSMSPWQLVWNIKLILIMCYEWHDDVSLFSYVTSRIQLRRVFANRNPNMQRTELFYIEIKFDIRIYFLTQQKVNLRDQDKNQKFLTKIGNEPEEN